MSIGIGVEFSGGGKVTTNEMRKEAPCVTFCKSTKRKWFCLVSPAPHGGYWGNQCFDPFRHVRRSTKRTPCDLVTLKWMHPKQWPTCGTANYGFSKLNIVRMFMRNTETQPLSIYIGKLFIQIAQTLNSPTIPSRYSGSKTHAAKRMTSVVSLNCRLKYF